MSQEEPPNRGTTRLGELLRPLWANALAIVLVIPLLLIKLADRIIMVIVKRRGGLGR